MTEQSSMQRRPRGARGITGALILIALGIAFLLSNLEIVNFNWWALLRYWPVFLILVGLDLLLGRSALGSVVVALIGLAVLGGVFWLASTESASVPGFIRLSGETVTREFSEPLGDVNRLDRVEINIGAGETYIGTSDDTTNVVEGSYTTDRELDLRIDYNPDDSILIIEQESPENFMPGDSYIGQLDLTLLNTVAIEHVNFNFGAGEFELDLSELDVQTIDIEGGIGSIQIWLPAEGEYMVEVSAGIGNVEIMVPDSMEAQITTDVAITNVDVSSRFTKADNVYTTSEFGSASNQATIHIETAVGNVDVQ